MRKAHYTPTTLSLPCKIGLGMFHSPFKNYHKMMENITRAHSDWFSHGENKTFAMFMKLIL